MISLNNQELFKKYYQIEYDFNTTALTEEEIDEIKELVKEKRVNYALAPVGVKIFDWISEQASNIRFELADFDSDKIDGLLYIPQSGLEKAYIVLNSKKPLINQIFAAVHEYYHYVTDYAKIKRQPYICSLSALQNVNEKKACRFAAEFLLPEDALRNEVKFFKKRMPAFMGRKMEFDDYAILSIFLTVKYQLPLKAVLYRLYEEKYINNVDEYIKNYDFIKSVLLGINIFEDDVKHLYSTGNAYLKIEGLIYRQMKMAYDMGYATREEILSDAEVLDLDIQLISEFFDVIEEDEDEDDTELMSRIKQIWRPEE